MRLALSAIGFAVGLFLSCLPMHAADDPFPGAPRGKIHVRIELSGSHRVDMPSGVEWAAIEAWRTLELDFALVDVGNDGLPIVSKGAASANLSPDMDALKGKIEACGEDQMCLAKTMMDFAQSGRGGGNSFLRMTGQQPGRYRNFASDRQTTCASGTLVVKDVLSGVYIPPPEPARAYRFTRNGSQTLPKDDFNLMDHACAIEVTLDQATGQMSLRLPAAKLAVPVTLGPGAFTDETAVPLIEGLQALELFDQPAGRDGAWTGIAEIKSAGSASHNSGQVSAPLKARVSWSFSEG